MKTATECGLTQGQWEALRDETGDASFSLEIEQYSLSLTSHDSDGHGSSIDNFDAIVCDDTIVRAWRSAADTISIQTLADEDGGDQSWSAAVTLTATGIDEDVPVTLATDGSINVRVFYYDGTAGQIEYFANAAKGVGNAASWGSSTLAASQENVQFIAAVSLTRVHYAFQTAAYNTRLAVASYSGSWSSSNSVIYWQCAPTSFDAITGPQIDDGAAATNDIIAMSTSFPPIISRKLESTVLTYDLSEVQGIAILRYQNGRWSNHYEFDLVDEAASFPSRHDVKLSSYGGLLFLTYTRHDGTATYSHTAMALSRSKDGIHWEMPYLMTGNLSGPSILLVRGKHAYALDSWKTYRSPRVGYTGGVDSATDISTYALALAVPQGDIAKLTATLSNPEQVLDSSSPLMDDVLSQARLKLGYWVSGTERVTDVGLFDIEAIGGRLQMPMDHAQIQARDQLARLTSFRADRSIEWESQQAGGDNYEPTDNTDYSGLRHTAPQQGSFKAKDNNLVLVGSEQVGVAFSTYLSDAWNGSAQAGFKVTKTETDDYAGLVFRAYDKDNMMAAYYSAEDDLIYLEDRRIESRQRIASSGAMSWSVDTWYYLMVRFRYGYVAVYSSTDGITWAEQIVKELTGKRSTGSWDWDSFEDREIPQMSGRTGVIGHGYSDEDDSWSVDPLPPITLPDPADDIPEIYDQFLVGTRAGGIAYADTSDVVNFESFNWTACNGGLATVNSKIIRDIKFLQRRDVVYTCTADGLFYTSLPVSGSSTWQCLVSPADIKSAIGKPSATFASPFQLAISWYDDLTQWLGVCCGGYTNNQHYVLKTTDGWQSFSYAALPYSSTPAPEGFSAVDVARHSGDGTIWATGGYTTWGEILFKSTDGGGTFAAVAGATMAYTGQGVIVPDGGSTDQYVFCEGTNGNIYGSKDAGASFVTQSIAPSGGFHMPYRQGTLVMYEADTYDVRQYNAVTGLFETWWPTGPISVHTPKLIPIDALCVGWGTDNALGYVIGAGNKGGSPMIVHYDDYGNYHDLTQNFNTVITSGASADVIGIEGGQWSE